MLYDIKEKLGKDYKDVYANNSIEDANKIVIHDINSRIPGHIAFSIDNVVKISKTNDIFGDVISIYDYKDNLITDISSLVNNNGEYAFVLKSNDVVYDAIFDKFTENLELTPR
nr:MAG TPA: hypothetical protein [Bacteriophage sp.]